MKNLLILDDGKLIKNEYYAKKLIPKNAVFFEGHYPDSQILPGVFHLELASIAAKKFLLNIKNSNFCLVKVIKYRFFKSVLPGEMLSIRVKQKERSELGWVVSTDLSIGNELVSSGTLVMGEKIPYGLKGDILPEPDLAKRDDYMGIDKIIQILPHRYPFLQLDRVIKIVGMEKISGIKNITTSDYMLWGRDILSPFPQSIMIEALSQCAGILGLQLMSKNGVALFGSITNAIFTDNAYPGDQLILEASVIRALSDGCIMSGRIWVNNRLVCDIENMVSAVR
jgi:3-hydroxyacyl-[acyl-carrier-protein] dehydratase